MCFYVFAASNETQTFNNSIYITELLKQKNISWGKSFGEYLKPKVFPKEYFIKPTGVQIRQTFYSKFINGLGDYICLRNTWHPKTMTGKPWNGEFGYDITFNDLVFDECYSEGSEDVIQLCGIHKKSESHYCHGHPPMIVLNANGPVNPILPSGTSGWLWVGITVGVLVIVGVVIMCVKQAKNEEDE